MPSYKLHYFPVRAMGEPMELMLLHTETPYEVKRIPFDEWMKVKGSYPRGTIPVLEVDGKFLCEVAVIIKYLGDRLGLCPSDSWEDAKAMELTNGYSDLYVSIRTFFVTPPGEEREKFVKDKQENYARPFLANMEAALGNASGWLYDKISYADFSMHNLASLLQHLWGVDLKDYPKVAAHKARIEALPKLRGYFAEKSAQPITPFQPYKDIDGEMTKRFREMLTPKDH